MEDFVDFKVAGGDLLEGPGRGVFFSFFYRWAKQGVEFQVGTWEGAPARHDTGTVLLNSTPSRSSSDGLIFSQLGVAGSHG